MTETHENRAPIGHGADDQPDSPALDHVAMDELSSPEAIALFDAIDSLQELHIGEMVDLPQIVVVGDQSSGKSSVLDAISGVRFPAKGELCTRFATEVVIRRAPETRIDVKINASGPRPPQTFIRTTFDKDALPEIISEAAEKMKVGRSDANRFSQDVLRVEIAGPHVYPLTLVDLPGFFHAETEDQRHEDKEIVRQLAERYMMQPKSIILIVVSANQNFANQIVTDEARKHDPTRDRTLGVITKPDLTGSENEKKYFQVIRGQESMHTLKLGWHVLRNRPEGNEDTSTQDRDAEEEKFFRTGAWSKISPASRGIAPLRKKLSRVLLDHIRKTLPGLIADIENMLSSRQRALDQLGKPRVNPEDMRTYLLEIADVFQRLTRNGLEGRYSDQFFGDLDDDRKARKLRALLRRLNSAFHMTLIDKGVNRKIEWEDEMGPSHYSNLGWTSEEGDVPEYLEAFLQLFDEFLEPPTISEMDLREELNQLAATNQGQEFPGLPNSGLGYQLLKMQVRPWGGIAECYVNQAINFSKSFVEDLLIDIIGADKHTANAVLAHCVQPFFEEKRTVLNTKLKELLRPHELAYSPALEADFSSALSSKAIGREAGRITCILEENFPAAFTEKGGRVLFMSLGTFAQNVVNLAVESCLISDLHTILAPSAVIRMSEQRLKQLASESEDVQLERQSYQHQVDILLSGLQKCQQFRPHERTVLPIAFSPPL
ncbi:hypothetical protein PG990_007528 [Apiospora arundinis]